MKWDIVEDTAAGMASGKPCARIDLLPPIIRRCEKLLGLSESLSIVRKALRNKPINSAMRGQQLDRSADLHRALKAYRQDGSSVL